MTWSFKRFIVFATTGCIIIHNLSILILQSESMVCIFINYIEYINKETIKSCLQASSMQQGQHWKMSITKLIIPDLTKNTWDDHFCLYFLVSVWDTSTKQGCNRCFFASKYGVHVALSLCVTRTSGRNEVNAFNNVSFF